MMGSRPHKAAAVSPQSLGIEGLAPDPEEDQGLSLEELGEAYAALLNPQRADPYPDEDEAPAAEEEGAADAEDRPLRVLSGSDDEACEITPRTIVEALLFVGNPAGEPLTSERIASLMRGVTPAEIDDLVADLNEEYAQQGRPYAIRSVAAGYQLVLCDQYAGLREHFYGKLREARLSQSAIDVLAIVAYNQPVTHEEIDKVRGRDSGAIISQLVRRDLIAIERPKEKKTKPIYRTTDRFLDLYHLESLEDLPQVEQG
ncbi:MAG TPA: SMC-Scp complex subunit ScpB [Pirellulaceae bacterium]|nr:SMC-Scp complex subunit ScpB [Pirellulaceae bacterium]